jgi:hypothetical protein
VYFDNGCGHCGQKGGRPLSRLKYDPLKYFEGSPSIYGPLAKRRAKQSLDERDQSIVQSFIDRMKESQETDGSWRGATTDTVRSLELLRLVQVPRTEKWVKKAIAWLLAQHNGPTAYRQGFFDLPESVEHLTGNLLPTGETTTSETSLRHVYGELSLAVLLRYGERAASQVQTALAAMRGLMLGRYSVKGFYCCGACTASVWQVYAAMPQSSMPRVIGDGMETLKAKRDLEGSWGAFPFYFTLWSLAQLPYAPARREIRYALERLRRTQRADGGFGQSDRDVKTFTVVAALSVL